MPFPDKRGSEAEEIVRSRTRERAPAKRLVPLARHLATIALLIAAVGVQAGEDGQRPRIGLVLGGGGARGAAHIGVIEVLERLRVPIDCVAGTSMGALVAGAYAAGLTPATMRSELGKADWDDLFRDDPPFVEQNLRRKALDRRFLPASETGVGPEGVKYQTGIVSGQKIKLFFNHLVRADLGERSIETLPIPLSIIATDLVSGEKVVFREASLTTAMRASMSVPGLMSPVALDGKKLVDGGLVDNVPIREARSRCQADRVIAVNVGSPLLKAEDISGLLSVSAQMVNILTEQNVTRSLAALTPDDIYIKPNLDGISAGDFKRSSETADRGVQAAEAVAERLRALSVGENEYARWSASVRLANRPAPRIDEIEIAGLQRVNPAVVERHIRIHPGDPLDPAQVNADLLRAYGDGYYENVDYALLTTLRGRNILRVSPLEKSWGPDYIHYGVNLSADTAANATYSLRAAYRKTWLNPLGGEFLASGELGSKSGLGFEYYQPLDERQRVFAEMSARIGRELSPVYQDGNKLAEYQLGTGEVRLGLGANIGLLGQARVGWKESRWEARLKTGLPLFSEARANYGGWFAGVEVDQTDRLYFPTSGWSSLLKYFDSPSGGYSRVDAQFSGHGSLGDWVLHGRVSYQGALVGNLPGYDLGTLGGMLNMTAFAVGQLKGDDMRYASLSGERIIGRLPLGLRGDLRLGMALEAARIGRPATETHLTSWINSTALYLGGETPLGPVYLAYGYSKTGSQGTYANLYLFLGTP